METEYRNDACESRVVRPSVYWLQGITVLWMVIECGVSLFAAARAHSPALLAFGSDSLVELLSASLVLLQFTPGFTISKNQAAKAAAVLMFALAGIVPLIAGLSLAGRVQPEKSLLGIGLTVIAFLIMPVL